MRCKDAALEDTEQSMCSHGEVVSLLRPIGVVVDKARLQIDKVVAELQGGCTGSIALGSPALIGRVSSSEH